MPPEFVNIGVVVGGVVSVVDCGEYFTSRLVFTCLPVKHQNLIKIFSTPRTFPEVAVWGESGSIVFVESLRVAIKLTKKEIAVEFAEFSMKNKNS